MKPSEQRKKLAVKKVRAAIPALARAYNKPRSTLADVKRAKDAFDAHRARNEALGMEVCLVVVGYVTGRDPFRLLGRVSADTGFPAMPDPPLTMDEMQPVAFAAKMALAKVLSARKRAQKDVKGRKVLDAAK